MQPDRSGGTGDVENYANPGRLHLVHNLVEPIEIEPALRWLERMRTTLKPARFMLKPLPISLL